MMLQVHRASTLKPLAVRASQAMLASPSCWANAFQVLEPDPQGQSVRSGNQGAPGCCAEGPSRPLSMRESKLMFGSFSWRSSRLVRGLIAVGLAIIGAVLVWAALVRPSTPEPALAPAPNDQSMSSTSPSAPKPTPERATPGADEPDLRDQITGLVLPESEPVAVSIPRIRVRSRLVPLGLEENGAMETPKPADVGWYSRGPSPGALGPAVIAGHVTWNGPAVFYRLGTMRRGDHVSVTRKDGKTAVFTVTRVAQFPQSRFPSRVVYGPIDHAGLRLITCGGTYDAARHKYLDNVVVFAKLEAVRER
jgi:sortase (surface protein transpeptidase)